MSLLRRPAARPGFTPLRVAAIDPVADRAVSIAFDVSAPEHATHLDYVAGQYLTLDAMIDGERRVFTGDRGRYDGDFIIMLGRASQVINSGGEKIFAEEVEAALKAVDCIADAVVLGVADDRFGQRVAAVVQADTGRELDFDAVDSALRTGLAGYKIPAAYWVADTIGRHPSSKTDYGWAKRFVEDNAPVVDRRSGARA